MEQSGYYRKYIILQELDKGYGVQRSPEGFARLDGNRDGLTISVQIRYLREGTEPYTVILVFRKDGETGILRAGNLEFVSRAGFLRRKLDYEAIQAMGMLPEHIQYVIIASEHQEKLSIPLSGNCNKSYPWDESIRVRLMKKEAKQPKSSESEKSPAAEQAPAGDLFPEIVQAAGQRTPEPQKTIPGNVNNPHDLVEESPNNPESIVDDVRLERKLRDTFEVIEPFSNPRQDYAWYRVNDLARLSNLLFACNMRIPLFANPRILVGLFKYRHLLAGFYRSDRNGMKYFVLGVPSKDDSEGKPFENISRWVPSQNVEYGDMTGYWLVYINLKSGEFVR